MHRRPCYAPRRGCKNDPQVGREKKVLHRKARGLFDTVASVKAFIAHREAVVSAATPTGTYAEARTVDERKGCRCPD